MKLSRDGDRALQLLLFNEEYLVSASHQLALITSLPFVHTARRYYRWCDLIRYFDNRKFTKLVYIEEIKVVTRFS